MDKFVKGVLKFVKPTVENLNSVGDSPRLKSLTEENVLLQLENLKLHPAVAARLEEGEERRA